MCLKPPEEGWNQAADTEDKPFIRLAARVLEPGTEVAAVPSLGASLPHRRTVRECRPFLGMSVLNLPKSCHFYPRTLDPPSVRCPLERDNVVYCASTTCGDSAGHLTGPQEHFPVPRSRASHKQMSPQFSVRSRWLPAALRARAVLFVSCFPVCLCGSGSRRGGPRARLRVSARRDSDCADLAVSGSARVPQRSVRTPAAGPLPVC